MNKITVFLILVFTISVNAQRNDEQLKTQKIEELFKITKVDQTIPYLVNTIITKLKSKYPNVSDNEWNKIRNSINYKEFIEKSKNIYMSNYSLNEIEELIRLYSSKSIEAYKEKTKKVEAKLYELGNSFGQKIITDIMKMINEYNK